MYLNSNSNQPIERLYFHTKESIEEAKENGDCDYNGRFKNKQENSQGNLYHYAEENKKDEAMQWLFGFILASALFIYTKNVIFLLIGFFPRFMVIFHLYEKRKDEAIIPTQLTGYESFFDLKKGNIVIHQPGGNFTYPILSIQEASNKLNQYKLMIGGKLVEFDGSFIASPLDKYLQQSGINFQKEEILKGVIRTAILTCLILAISLGVFFTIMIIFEQ